MRQDLRRFHLLAIVAVAATTAASASTAAAATAGRIGTGQSLTLYEHPSFQGRHAVYREPSADLGSLGFTARSARSTGLWTLCDGRRLESRCQTVNGAAAKLKLEPAIVRPGVDAVALYERPGLKGRRVVYSFPSDQPPGFKPRSARTWGGPWSLCDARRCETIDGAKARAIDVNVIAVQPGSAPVRVEVTQTSERRTVILHPMERLQIAMAAPPRTPPVPPAPLSPPEPPRPERPPEGRVRAEPAAPVLADDEEASPYEPARGYVDIPLPPRRTEPVRVAEPVHVAAPRPPARRPDDGLRRVAYQCEGGGSLNVVFDDWHETAKVQSPGEGPVFLQKVGSTEGFRYEDRDLALFGEHGEVSFVSGDREPLDCWSPAARRQFSAR